MTDVQAVSPSTESAKPKPKKKKYTPEQIAKFKKTGRKSSRKGKARERKLAKLLSRWWTCGKDSKAFRRTPQSGGFPKKRSHGDVLPITFEASLFPFVIDVKDRKTLQDFEFADLLVNSKSKIFAWFDELSQIIAENPAMHAGKMRLMVIHKNQKDYCMVGSKEIEYITLNAGRIPNIKINHTHGNEVLYVFPLKELFLKDPETLKSVKVPNAQ